MLTLELLVNGDSQEKKAIADKIAAAFGSYGITAAVTALPYDQYTARVEARQYDIFIGELEVAPTQDFTELLGGGNMFNYGNDSINTLITQIGMTSDAEALRTLYSELASAFCNDMPFVPIFYAKEYMLSSPKLGDLRCPSISGFYRLPGGWKLQ